MEATRIIQDHDQVTRLPRMAPSSGSKAMLMRIGGRFSRAFLLVLAFVAGARVWAQGPPYQTDDPVPVEYKHYEFYIFGTADGTPVEVDSLPVWLQKNFGPWLLDGGAGETVISQTGYRDFPYGGFLLKYTFPGDRLEFGGEVFSHGKEGFAAPQTQASTMTDLGSYYHFKHNPNRQLLFCYGHSIAGQTENYAYLGLYWTRGGKKGDKARREKTRPGRPMQMDGFR